MTINDVIQELVDINDWEATHSEQYVYNIKPVSTINGEYHFMINVHEGYIGINKMMGGHSKIYFFGLTDSETDIVKSIYSPDKLSYELKTLYKSEDEYNFIANLQHVYDDTDVCQIGIKEYTYYFIWCCHAIVWAIREYRKMKKGENK